MVRDAPNWAVTHRWEAAFSGMLLLKAVSFTKFFMGRNSGFAKQKIKAENNLKKINKIPSFYSSSTNDESTSSWKHDGFHSRSEAGQKDIPPRSRRFVPGTGDAWSRRGMGPAEDGHPGVWSKGKQEQKVGHAVGLASRVSRKG